jgi:hypothetical protein
MSLSGILITVLLASLLLEVLLTIVYVSRASDDWKIYPTRPRTSAASSSWCCPTRSSPGR